jgi:hypothetical protein
VANAAPPIGVVLRRQFRYTHRSTLRAPRPVDDEFREWWALGQAVLHRIATQFETIYGEALPRVEELAAIPEPKRADLSELREQVPHGDVALDRFFATATPGWFQLLRGAGYFADPAPLQPDDEGRVAYVPWPPGQYLVRLVAEDEYRTEVVAIARALADQADSRRVRHRARPPCRREEPGAEERAPSAPPSRGSFGDNHCSVVTREVPKR